MKRISILWDMVKLEILIVCSRTYSWIAQMKYEQCEMLSRQSIFSFWEAFKKTRHYVGVYYVNFIYTKHIVLDVQFIRTIANIFCALMTVAWLCEKMKVNLKVEGLSDFFENDIVINNQSKYQEARFESTKKFYPGAAKMAWVGVMYMRSEYGYKILSKLSVKKDLQKCADEWFANHIEGDWVAVHFRGTDFKDMKIQYKSRYRLLLDDYITYLRGVLNKQCSILVCSDQAQFIDKMHIAFPGRVFARDIQRSNDNRMLHIDYEYSGAQQKRDAFIDILILAKADLVYTTGSGFVDMLRFLNPLIKIISLDERWLLKSFSIGRGSSHGVPIPEKALFKSLIKNYRKNEAD